MCAYRLRSGLLAIAALALLATPAAAEVSTERSASILIFPKVLFVGGFDTILQISNTSNSLVHAHCFYVNAALENPEEPEGPTNPRQWQEIDFDIVLTAQQPSHWIVSEGRVPNPFDPTCSPTNTDCNDAGFDPGRIPPVPPGFEGELKCIEVDQSGAPISGNHMKGEATLLTIDMNVDFGDGSSAENEGDASKYNAIGILGGELNDGNNVLCLGGGPGEHCPAGREYQGCPEVVLVSHYAEGAVDPVLPGDPTTGNLVASQLTVVPCAQDFETQIPARVRVQFAIFNEFEEPFSTSTTVECWDNFFLADVNPVLTVGSLGTRFVQTRLRPAEGDPGFVAVLEEFHGDGSRPSVARSALNLSVIGERQQTDLIVIPEGP